MIVILDACALLAFIRKEAGHKVVRAMIEDVGNRCFTHAINLCEVFYGVHRESGEAAALDAVADIKRLGIVTRPDMDEGFWLEAGRLKSVWCRVSLADCCAIVLTNRLNGELVTSDHHELDLIHKELADTRVEARERFDQVDARLGRMDRKFDVITSDLMDLRAAQRDVEGRVSMMEQRPS